jgi:hypothetical protein
MDAHYALIPNIFICLSHHQDIIIELLLSEHHTKPNSHKRTTTLTPSCADFDSDHFHPNIHLNPIRTAYFIDLSLLQI